MRAIKGFRLAGPRVVRPVVVDGNDVPLLRAAIESDESGCCISRLTVLGCKGGIGAHPPAPGSIDAMESPDGTAARMRNAIERTYDRLQLRRGRRGCACSEGVGYTCTRCENQCEYDTLTHTGSRQSRSACRIRTD